MVKLFFVGSIPLICFHPQTIINNRKAEEYKIGDNLFTNDKRLLTIVKVFRVPHKTTEPYVKFLPNSFAPNIPDKQVIVTLYHIVKYNGQAKFAIKWLTENNIGTYYYDNNNYSLHFLVNSPTNTEFINCNGLEVDVIGLNNRYLSLLEDKKTIINTIPK